MLGKLLFYKIAAESPKFGGDYIVYEEKAYEGHGPILIEFAGSTLDRLMEKVKDKPEFLRVACDKFYAEIMDSISDFYDMPEVLEQLAIITRNNLETISKMREVCRERSYQN